MTWFFKKSSRAKCGEGRAVRVEIFSNETSTVTYLQVGLHRIYWSTGSTKVLKHLTSRMSALWAPTTRTISDDYASLHAFITKLSPTQNLGRMILNIFLRKWVFFNHPKIHSLENHSLNCRAVLAVTFWF